MNSDENRVVPPTAAVASHTGRGAVAATGTAPSPHGPIRALKRMSGDPLVPIRGRAGRRP